MGSSQILAAVLFLSLVSGEYSQSVIRIKPEYSSSGIFDIFSGVRKIRVDDSSYCESWKFSVENNDAGSWETFPDRCVTFVTDYMTGDQYKSDSEIVAGDSLNFAKTVEVAGDGKDAWVFDIDETLLSNLPFYADHGFGAETFNESAFDDWVDLAEAPALPASLSLYNEVQELGFTIFLLTGRSEFQRNVTVKNLQTAGYSNWTSLILRGTSSDQGKSAVVYKSEKRMEIQAEGYTIHGSSGDQWSDLMGFATADRSFKLPNPMYYIA